jgi:cbb3-type cytochrome c oxidase subunit III
MKSYFETASKVLLLALGVLVLAATVQAADQPDGAAIFKQKCAMCHGPDGKGFAAIKTPDFTDPKIQASVTDKQIQETIENGKKGTPMPPFKDKLKDDEIQTMVKYIRSLNSEKSEKKK